MNNIALKIDTFNRSFGRIVAYLALGIVLIQFLVVLMRYVFGVGSIFLQESILYQHAMLFMLGAAYTLLVDGHVRLDVFYRGFNARLKYIINIFGVLFFLIPTCVVIWLYSFPYVQQSWRVFEGSKETSGLPIVYLLKTVILIFSVLLMLQGISLLITSLNHIRSRSKNLPKPNIH